MKPDQITPLTEEDWEGRCELLSIKIDANETIDDANKTIEKINTLERHLNQLTKILANYQASGVNVPSLCNCGTFSSAIFLLVGTNAIQTKDITTAGYGIAAACYFLGVACGGLGYLFSRFNPYAHQDTLLRYAAEHHNGEAYIKKLSDSLSEIENEILVTNDKILTDAIKRLNTCINNFANQCGDVHQELVKFKQTTYPQLFSLFNHEKVAYTQDHKIKNLNENTNESASEKTPLKYSIQ